MRIILTGSTGLIGSRFEELMFESHEIIPLSSSQGVDVTDEDSIINFFNGKEADVIIHLAAKTDVDGCETDKSNDLKELEVSGNDIPGLNIHDVDSSKWKGKKSAFAINAMGTKNLCETAKARGIKFVYISTDFVFPGEGEYTEESQTRPINWYGMTKWCGERFIDSARDLLVRLSFPYGYPSPVKPDFIQKIIGFLRDNDEVSLISDQTITPTFIDDIVFGLDFLLQKNATGIYHLSGSSSEDPYHIGQKIKEVFGYKANINPAKREQIYIGKAPRPFKSVMRNDMIRRLGFTPKTFDEGLELIKSSI